MERWFQGESLNKVDGKGRLSIPVKFRRVLANSDSKSDAATPARLYIAYGDKSKNYLECLSGDAFDKIDAMIQATPLGTPVRRALEFLYYQKCDETQVDETGRLVLPQAAREKIRLSDDALFQGMGDKFHILNPVDAAAADEGMDALLAALGQGNEFFDPLSLVASERSDGDGGR